MIDAANPRDHRIACYILRIDRGESAEDAVNAAQPVLADEILRPYYCRNRDIDAWSLGRSSLAHTRVISANMSRKIFIALLLVVLLHFVE